ncbi:N-acetylmuramic acid 6-phosphate etherase, partial [Mesorhizobium ciceri]|uniref:N-acetylmuramic acid 6-phosphate etherase n=1 Tax=Mesorhizobium ciceri TaxID=39645 RepID=UPI00344FFC70
CVGAGIRWRRPPLLRQHIRRGGAGGGAAAGGGGPPPPPPPPGRAGAEAGLGKGDCLIAISASGTTPYAVRAIQEAARRGAATIGIANNRDSALLRQAQTAILLETPPELIAGSTRMGAGTAQKIALNMLSTLTAIHLGHVHDGYMVNLMADNIKLRDRAARIVAAVSGRGTDEAARLLEKSGGAVKTAILLAAGADSTDAAQKILEEAGQKLRPALSAIEGSKGSKASVLIKTEPEKGQQGD